MQKDFCKVDGCFRCRRSTLGYCLMHLRQFKSNGCITRNKTTSLCGTVGCQFWKEMKDQCYQCYIKSYRSRPNTQQARKKYYQRYVQDNSAIHKASQRRRNLQHKYGISEAQYIALLSKQNQLCAICLQSSEKTFHVDHDHKTGKIRGLLCSSCNLAIGLFKDNSKILIQAVGYLETR